MSGYELIDPADVKVGDVVEVEDVDGDWLVRGKVDMVDEPGTDYLLRIKVDCDRGAAIWPCVPGNTVRLVRRAEPEPDPELVTELASQLAAAAPDRVYVWGSDEWTDFARELVRRGVTVETAGETP